MAPAEPTVAPPTAVGAQPPPGAAADPHAARVLYAPQLPRPLRPDAASDVGLYRRWLDVREGWRLGIWAPPRPGPELTLLVVVDERTAADLLAVTLGSLAAQTTTAWQLSVSVIGAPSAELDRVLADGLASLPAGTPARAVVLTRPAGTPAPEALAAALEESSAPAFALLDAGDELVRDAVAQLSAALVDADVAYADEDRADADGSTRTPVLKPGWSPELFLGWRYTGRPVAMRVAPVIAAGGIRTLEGGDWEHDLLLRVTERTARVAHVADVLCHVHEPPQGVPPGAVSGPAAVLAALERRDEIGDVERGPCPGTWRVRRGLCPSSRGRLAVTVIVPFRDSTTLLRACADSVLSTAGRSDELALELLLVDNASTEPETATLLERLAGNAGVVVRRDDRPFNWAALNNAAAAAASGDVLCFLNDDVVALGPGWLELLCAHAMRPDVGAAGARLLYPDGRVQHVGIAIGIAGVCGHVLSGLPASERGYLGAAVLTRDVSAVTGACMTTRRDVFDRLGGFDEALGLDFNDVDYCLRARSRGLHVVVEPGAELWHWESPSRGTSGSEDTAATFLARWGDEVAAGDPFLSPNLSRLDFSMALDEPGASVSGVPEVARQGGSLR